MKSRVIKTAITLLVTAAVALAAVFCALRWLYPKKYQTEVERYAAQYGIDPDLVYSIIKCESNFTPDAVSAAGACGLMQITSATYEWVLSRENAESSGKNSLFDPATNIRYGCAIYALLSDELKEPAVALAAYNAGRGRVLSWLSNDAYSADGKTLHTIPFAETDGYVEKVLNAQKIYKLIY